jgi:hypothetical protein
MMMMIIIGCNMICVTIMMIILLSRNSPQLKNKIHEKNEEQKCRQMDLRPTDRLIHEYIEHDTHTHTHTHKHTQTHKHAQCNWRMHFARVALNDIKNPKKKGKKGGKGKGGKKKK